MIKTRKSRTTDQTGSADLQSKRLITIRIANKSRSTLQTLKPELKPSRKFHPPCGSSTKAATKKPLTKKFETKTQASPQIDTKANQKTSRSVLWTINVGGSGLRIGGKSREITELKKPAENRGGCCSSGQARFTTSGFKEMST